MTVGQNRWSLEGMKALVTGGTKGLGHAVLEEFAELGVIVLTCARNEAELNDRLHERKMKGFIVTGSVCDASSKAEQKKLLNKAIMPSSLHLLCPVPLLFASAIFYLLPMLFASKIWNLSQL